MHASPVKRRVLGGLDPNACSPKVKHDTNQTVLSPVKAKGVPPHPAEKENALSPAATTSPTKARDSTPSKRFSLSPPMTVRDDLTENSEPAPKRPRLNNGGEVVQQQPAERVTRAEVSISPILHTPSPASFPRN